LYVILNVFINGTEQCNPDLKIKIYNRLKLGQQNVIQL
jgi:hypothetical protein